MWLVVWWSYTNTLHICFNICLIPYLVKVIECTIYACCNQYGKSLFNWCQCELSNYFTSVMRLKTVWILICRVIIRYICIDVWWYRVIVPVTTLPACRYRTSIYNACKRFENRHYMKGICSVLKMLHNPTVLKRDRHDSRYCHSFYNHRYVSTYMWCTNITVRTLC